MAYPFFPKSMLKTTVTPSISPLKLDDGRNGLSSYQIWFVSKPSSGDFGLGKMKVVDAHLLGAYMFLSAYLVQRCTTEVDASEPIISFEAYKAVVECLIKLLSEDTSQNRLWLSLFRAGRSFCQPFEPPVDMIQDKNDNANDFLKYEFEWVAASFFCSMISLCISHFGCSKQMNKLVPVHHFRMDMRVINRVVHFEHSCGVYWLHGKKIDVPLVTRSILEVVIPEYAVPKLITKSRNKLAQISEVLYFGKIRYA
ncbi:hypothetical protein M8C21_008470 [Ambrosia artemisiifolia]|uniref:Uncharacterized protein n=1 Tax=Ambrosia artemisiifolia TaxID=4212 RepID=A0AAD5BTN4_AMBAR|nr:hypothetical protein M8C21_008470 [Ambrosia artemisiifolia]